MGREANGVGLYSVLKDFELRARGLQGPLEAVRKPWTLERDEQQSAVTQETWLLDSGTCSSKTVPNQPHSCLFSLTKAEPAAGFLGGFLPPENHRRIDLSTLKGEAIIWRRVKGPTGSTWGEG